MLRPRDLARALLMPIGALTAIAIGWLCGDVPGWPSFATVGILYVLALLRVVWLRRKHGRDYEEPEAVDHGWPFGD